MAFEPTHFGRKVRIEGLAPASTLTGYTAVITEDNLPSEIWSLAEDGGGDIRASIFEDGTSQLPLEIVKFDTATQKATIWTRFPTYSTSNRELWLFYDKAGETQPIVTDTYGRNSVWIDWDAIFHFSETSGAFINSAGDGDDASATDDSYITRGYSGLGGDGVYFDGSDIVRDGTKALQPPNTDNGNSYWNNEFSQKTLITWCAPRDILGAGPKVLLEEGGSSHGYSLIYRTGPEQFSIVYASDSVGDEVVNSEVVSKTASNKSLIASIFNSGAVSLFVDGNKTSTTLSYSTIPEHGSTAHIIGFNANNSGIYAGHSANASLGAINQDNFYPFEGAMFGLWRASTAFSDDFINTLQSNTDDASLFWTTDTPKDTVAPSIIALLNTSGAIRQVEHSQSIINANIRATITETIQALVDIQEIVAPSIITALLNTSAAIRQSEQAQSIINVNIRETTGSQSTASANIRAIVAQTMNALAQLRELQNNTQMSSAAIRSLVNINIDILADILEIENPTIIRALLAASASLRASATAQSIATTSIQNRLIVNLASDSSIRVNLASTYQIDAGIYQSIGNDYEITASIESEIIKKIRANEIHLTFYYDPINLKFER